MFPNLLAEMARKCLSNLDLAKLLDLSDRTIRHRMSGSYDFTLSEMELIRDTHFPEHSLEYLFARKKPEQDSGVQHHSN